MSPEPADHSPTEVSPGTGLPPDEAVEARADQEPAVRHLEREIEQVKLRLRETVEQYEASTAELKARNEELLTVNQELQSKVEQLGCSEDIFQPVGEGDGAAHVMAGSTRVFTERKRMEAELRASEEKLRLIVENARDYAIVSLDLERRITSWNAGAQAILGYSQEEALGKSGDIIFTPEDCAAHAASKEAGIALAEGRALDERWHVRKDGRRFWGSGVMMAMRDARGEAIGLVKIFRDQTAALRAKEALEQSLQETERARADAEAAGHAKDHFLAVLSHELRTPLTPVLMAVDTLGRRKDLPEPVTDALEMIRRNVELEAHFIDDLLDLTRIARGKLELVREPMDVHAAIHRAVEVSQGDIEGKQQRLSLSLDAETSGVCGDAMRLQQVFWNLLKNASKFTPESGSIRLASRNQDGRIVVEVSDSGMGFEPEAAARIFDAFAQANQAITREFGGLGLGLAISKATVDGHGGSLSARSEGPAKGATFTVELPLGEDPPEQSSPPVGAPT